MRRFERTDDFHTIFAEDIADARCARRHRLQAMARDFCALSAIAAFGMVLMVWAGALAPAADPETVVLVSEVMPPASEPAFPAKLKGGADK